MKISSCFLNLQSKFSNHLYYSILTPKGASQAYHLTEVGFFKAPITEHLRVTELPAWAWMSGPPSILTTGTTIRIMGHSLIFKLAAGSSKWRRKGQEISECKYEGCIAQNVNEENCRILPWILRTEFLFFFIHSLGNATTSYFCSEISWPLPHARVDYYTLSLASWTRWNIFTTK